MKHDLTLSSLSCKITASVHLSLRKADLPPPPPPPPLVLENGRLAPHPILFSHMPIKSLQCKPCKFVGQLGLAVSIPLACRCQFSSPLQLSFLFKSCHSLSMSCDSATHIQRNSKLALVISPLNAEIILVLIMRHHKK